MAFTSVIFDFDYTLADSSPGVIECVNTALQEMGFTAAPDEAIRATIGSSLPKTFLILTGDQSSERSTEFFRRFVRRADQVMVNRTVLLSHVAAPLAELSQRGLLLGIVSTKFRYRIEAFLEREHLDHLFEVIVGGEDVAEHKPDPSGLARAMELLHMKPSDILYVGDSVVDAETAQRADVAFVAVLSGVTPRRAFAGHKILALLNNLLELPPFMESQTRAAIL